MTGGALPPAQRRPPGRPDVGRPRAADGEQVEGRPEFAVQVREDGGVTAVRVVGELDSDTVARLRVDLLDAVAQGPTRLELDALDFIDSAGLSVLIAADRRARTAGHPLTLTGVHGMTRKLLRLTGLDRLLTVEPPPD